MTAPIILLGNLLGLVGWILEGVGAIVFVDRFNRPSRERYRSQFKQRVVQRLVKHYNPSFHYSAQNGISKTVFNDSQIFRSKSDRYHCEDLVSGKIGSTRFRFSEVYAEHIPNSKKGREHETLFSGLFFVADFNKFFKGVTVVSPNLMGRMGGVGQVLEGIGKVGRLSIDKPTSLLF